MTRVLRQSTAVDVRIGPFVDVTNGYEPETGITLGAADEAEALRAGTATLDISAATWAAVTGADGWYTLSLSTTATNTVGELVIVVQDDSVCLPVYQTFQVIEEAAYDALYAASAPGPATPTNITAGTITTVTNLTNAPTAGDFTATMKTSITTAVPTVAGIADGVWDEDATGHQTGGTFGQAIGDPAADTTTIYAAVVTGAAGTHVAADIIAIKTETASILTDTAEIGAAGAGLTEAGGTGDHLTALATQASVTAIDDILDTEFPALVTAVADLPTNAELATSQAAADDATLAAIAALNNLSAAQVNAEVVDALATDTYAEPGQGTPAATAALSTKIGYLYKSWRNRSTMTSSEYALYADDATTKDQEAIVSDNGTTFDRGEISTGA